MIQPKRVFLSVGTLLDYNLSDIAIDKRGSIKDIQGNG